MTLTAESITLVNTQRPLSATAIIGVALISITLIYWSTNAINHFGTLFTLTSGTNALIMTNGVLAAVAIVDHALIPVATSHTITVESINARALE